MEPVQPVGPMQPVPPNNDADEKAWRSVFSGTDPGLRFIRGFWLRVPSKPRCKMCASPFGGVGGALAKVFWHAPVVRNPLMCRACDGYLRRHPGGAQIEISVLFADVRDSTSLAERISPAEFRNRLQAFYAVVENATIAHDGIIDKYMGDGVMALFIPGLSGAEHAPPAVAAGRELLREMSRLPEPRLSVGVGVHSGTAYVGVVGNTRDRDFSALGDVVNVAARLGSAALAGELLVSADTARTAQLDTTSIPHRVMELKGRHEPLEVVSL